MWQLQLRDDAEKRDKRICFCNSELTFFAVHPRLAYYFWFRPLFVTRIDRYILLLYFRTLLICFCSLGGIFVVFHAFSNLDALADHVTAKGGFLVAMVDYYGPYLFVIFESMAPVLALLSLLFTIGWLRQSGELTAMLASGVSHGRLVRPMLIAALGLVLFGIINRELVLPQFRDRLGAKPAVNAADSLRPIQPCYDRQIGILVEGKGVIAGRNEISNPAFRLFTDYSGFGHQLVAKTARWMEATAQHPAGFLLDQVQVPAAIDQLPSQSLSDTSVLLTAADNAWLQQGQCFVVTSVDIGLLLANGAGKKYTPLPDLVRRIRNPSVHTSSSIQVDLHVRLLSPLLDYTLVLLGLPLAVMRADKNLFTLVGQATILVLFFFGIKSLAIALGSNGYYLNPAMAAWIPVLILTPLGYVRYRDTQDV